MAILALLPCLDFPCLVAMASYDVESTQGRSRTSSENGVNERAGRGVNCGHNCALVTSRSWYVNTYSLVFTDGPEYVLTQRIHLAQNSEYTRTNDGVNVPCLTPSLLRPSLPLLLPLLLEVLLVRRLRVGVRVPLRVLAS